VIHFIREQFHTYKFEPQTCINYRNEATAYTTSVSHTLKGSDNLGDLGVDGRIIL